MLTNIIPPVKSIHLALLPMLACSSVPAVADVVTLNPVADAFLAASQPNSNYGGAGALAIAAAGLPQGEFQSLLRFDTSAAVAAFNTSFGSGAWSVQSVTLRLNAMNPANPFFNPQAPGQFGASWMPNDSWTEGTGMPNSPATVGVMFSTLPTLLSAADEPLGTFAFDGAISGPTTYSLALPAGFAADIASGGPVTIRLFAASASVAYFFNSRNFTQPSNWPALTITAAALPPLCAADFNGDHTLNVQDIFDSLAAWFAGDPRANFNGAGGVTVQDIFDFLAAWFAGC